MRYFTQNKAVPGVLDTPQRQAWRQIVYDRLRHRCNRHSMSAMGSIAVAAFECENS